MDELNSQAKQVLERARSEFTPSAEQLARLRARLDGTASPPSDPASASAGAKGWVVKLGLVVLTAALVTAGAILGLHREPPTPLLELGDVPISAARETLSMRGLLPSLAPFDRPRSFPRPRHDPSSVTEISTTRPSARVELDRSRPSGTASDTFAQELELVSRARRMLERRSFQAASKAARTYLRRFPHGSFVEEAEVVDLVASCGEHADADARRDAERYLARENARFASRVRQSCLDAPL